jgi:uncharacterized membrane protein (TIGR02234 family)
MTARRELLTAAGLCVLGAALVLVALSRAWISHRIGTAPLPSRTETVVGTHLASGARPLALVGVAGVAAVPATRRLGRLLVGVVVALAGVGVVLVVARALIDPAGAVRRAPLLVDAHIGGAVGLGGWPYVALLGALLLVAAGLLIVVRGRSWASMSSRYDAPAQRPREGEASLWEALDRGEDPTKEGTGTGG